MIKVSVIIPIYNSEKYLNKCLDSVLNQTLEEIEIICVNDGSTDSSRAILANYADGDSRIKIIDKNNEGLVAARKTGIKAAKGQYIGYVDSDDWIDPEMYEQLYKEASKYHVDLVTSGYWLEGNYTTEHLDTVEDGLYVEEKIKYLRDNTIYNLGSRETGLRGTLCCKLFKRELIAKAQLSVSDKISIAEDKMCLLSYILECSSVYVLRKAFYHYRINTNSMIHTPNSQYLLSVNEVYQHMIHLYEHPNFSREMRKQAEIYMVELLFKGINTRLGFENRNMLWIDPYWLDKIPANAYVALYGGGELGVTYMLQLANHKDMTYVGCVDFEYMKYANGFIEVTSPDMLKHTRYDYLVITIKNNKKAQQIRNQLEEFGVERDKILWYEQPEVFWKYVEAQGLLIGMEDNKFETGEIDRR